MKDLYTYFYIERWLELVDLAFVTNRLLKSPLERELQNAHVLLLIIIIIEGQGFFCNGSLHDNAGMKTLIAFWRMIQ